MFTQGTSIITWSNWNSLSNSLSILDQCFWFTFQNCPDVLWAFWMTVSTFSRCFQNRKPIYTLKRALCGVWTLVSSEFSSLFSGFASHPVRFYFSGSHCFDLITSNTFPIFYCFFEEYLSSLLPFEVTPFPIYPFVKDTLFPFLPLP